MIKLKPNLGVKSLWVASVLLSAALGAQAQATSSSSGGASPFEGAVNSYVGLSAGRSNFSMGRGTGLFESERRSNAYSLSVGRQLSTTLAFEAGYSDFGEVDRGGGRTQAEGLNLSVVGKLPLGGGLSLMGKLGTTYARTQVSSVLGSGIDAGRENRFGWAYGVGAEVVLSPQWSAVLQHEGHELKFAGGGRDRISMSSLGLRYRF